MGKKSISIQTVSHITKIKLFELFPFLKTGGYIPASCHNIHDLDVDIPLEVFCCVTGVSGSGKSTLVHDILYQNLARALRIDTQEEAAPVRDLQGASQLDTVRIVDQSPLSRTPGRPPLSTSEPSTSSGSCSPHPRTPSSRD